MVITGSPKKHKTSDRRSGIFPLVRPYCIGAWLQKRGVQLNQNFSWTCRVLNEGGRRDPDPTRAEVLYRASRWAEGDRLRSQQTSRGEVVATIGSEEAQA